MSCQTIVRVSLLPNASSIYLSSLPTPRDVFLAKGIEEEKTCDWHVDDMGFWPESFLSEASQRYQKNQDGVNVWIALDDMPYAGSMAVSPGSHRSAWRHDAYLALGQNRSEDGGLTREEIVRKMQGQTHYLTCDMHHTDPALYDRIEETAQQFDIKRGDVIFATRLLFHRTVPVSAEGRKHYAAIGKQFLNRYSIRYVPGSARNPNGWNVEWSVMANSQNVGKSLNDITEQEGGKAFYPQVWPTVQEVTDLDVIASMAEELATAAHNELMATLFGGGRGVATTTKS
jgi:hypothetical protein